MRKQEIILFLYRATKCHTEAEKIDFAKMSQLLTLEDKNETKYNRIEFLVLLRLTFEKTTKNKSEELM